VRAAAAGGSRAHVLALVDGDPRAGADGLALHRGLAVDKHPPGDDQALSA